MLDPSTRALFVDAFRPPTGFQVDLAVGTTYTLSLRMLLLPPLAMAAHDREATVLADSTDAAGGQPHLDTLALLESVRRYADRTTVYCHASGIGSLDRYPRLLAFAEDSVVQVLPRNPGFIFHPKVWALRFRRDDVLTHRLIVCSRNLTDDKSWDTLLVLDQGVDDAGISGAPAADFVRALPHLALGPVPTGRPEQTQDLASTLGKAWFEVPKPFTAGELRPLGISDRVANSWPMPDRPGRSLVVSPFLDLPTAARIRSRQDPVLVSRPETYDLVGADAVRHTRVKVLSPLAETEMSGDQASPDRPSEIRSGLHAKLLVWDEGRTGHLFTGSANATTAAFTGNVEFGVLLTGPRKSCGVAAMLPDDKPTRDRITFGSVLQDHTIPEPAPKEDPTLLAEREIERHHEALLQAGPRLICRPEDGGWYAVSLTFTSTPPTGPGTTEVRLVSRSKTERKRPAEAHWREVHLLELTPYLEVFTTIEISGVGDVGIASVLKAEMVDAPEDRIVEVLRSYLATEESIVRYLRFLLDEADIGSVWDDLELDVDKRPGDRAARGTFEDLAILEPMLRAAANGSEALDRVAALLRDLGVGLDDPGVVPKEFLELWSAIWSATKEVGD